MAQSSLIDELLGYAEFEGNYPVSGSMKLPMDEKAEVLHMMQVLSPSLREKASQIQGLRYWKEEVDAGNPEEGFTDDRAKITIRFPVIPFAGS